MICPERNTFIRHYCGGYITIMRADIVFLPFYRNRSSWRIWRCTGIIPVHIIRCWNIVFVLWCCNNVGDRYTVEKLGAVFRFIVFKTLRNIYYAPFDQSVSLVLRNIQDETMHVQFTYHNLNLKFTPNYSIK